LSDREYTIARQILKEIQARLGFLVDVGLDYLTLDRAAGTLSGGEAQRIRLATQIGSGLMGVLYILDEPSIGLHQRDNDRLIRTLKRLRDLGNTVIVVEHDEETIREADHLIDIGPGAGEHGGEVVAAGTVDDVMAAERSVTGHYLAGTLRVAVPERRRAGNGKHLVVRGARANNLKNLDVRLPLGKLVGVTGVSGSGKSTLVNEVLYKALAQSLYGARDRPGRHDRIEGIEFLDKVIDIDQSPIGRTPRSNPATYTGAFTPIRELFASVPEARVRGYLPGRFSFNVKGGRCEACRGEGIIQIEMQFLPDVYVPCEVCKGRRYNREALEIHYKGKTISDVLDMTVAEALAFFEAIPAVRNKLQTLNDVGLGYIRVGQPATTLSGGEAQRVKLSSELSRRATGRTLYILDEPTTGLHFADVSRLLEVLHRLVDTGNTVVVIEHNLDVVKTADWLIDLGPEGGDAGGQVLAEGTPEQVAAVEASYTGNFLRRALSLAASAA
jgi:excinuclease ABC subunit A